jgi:hypothetical protein
MRAVDVHRGVLYLTAGYALGLSDGFDYRFGYFIYMGDIAFTHATVLGLRRRDNAWYLGVASQLADHAAHRGATDIYAYQVVEFILWLHLRSALYDTPSRFLIAPGKWNTFARAAFPEEYSKCFLLIV